MWLWGDRVIRSVYCVGVGGVGVGALAEFLHCKGCSVSGSDPYSNQMTEHLSALGVNVFNHHDVAHLDNIDLVVYTNAVKHDMSVLGEARRLGIPVLKRGQLLAEIVNQSDSVVIAGTHGKTTTSSLLSFVLSVSGVEAGSFIGGNLTGEPSSVGIVDASTVIVEADESDGSFLYLRPKVAVITNIDPDHLEAYEGGFAELQRAFVKFANSVGPSGYVVACIDCPTIKQLLPSISSRVITYGFDESADIKAADYSQFGLIGCFSLKTNEHNKKVSLTMAGRHNVLNALAVIAVALQLEVGIDRVMSALGSFPGVDRRMQSHGVVSFKDVSVDVFEDYGHHPSELSATIKTCRQAWPDRRLVMVFQPHRYSRTKYFFDDFAAELSCVDLLFLMDVYSAGEDIIESYSSSALAESIKNRFGRRVVMLTDECQPDSLHPHLRENDVLLFQGAGSVGSLALSFVGSGAAIG